MNDRIKIAEAMGYAFIPLTDSWLTPCGKRTVKKLPDPFTSADDDSAVLEWMRGSDYDTHQDFAEALLIILVNAPLNYTVGDYARAALKVIDDE